MRAMKLIGRCVLGLALAFVAIGVFYEPDPNRLSPEARKLCEQLRAQQYLRTGDPEFLKVDCIRTEPKKSAAGSTPASP